MPIFNNIPDNLIWEQYQKDNYLIEINETIIDNRCCIYFSSNGLFFPETKQNFTEMIMDRNRFEWYDRRIKNVKKSIFVRDILKNFYVLGINAKYNTIEKLCAFLKEETSNYEIITVGSSAGGYAATICGLLLSAKTVFNFSGQISLWDYFDFKNKQFLQKYREKVEYCQYYDLYPFLHNNNSTKIVYVWAALAKEDVFQFSKVKGLDCEHFKSVAIRTHRHGMPMLPDSVPFFFDKENIKSIKSGGGDIALFFYNAVWWYRSLFQGYL